MSNENRFIPQDLDINTNNKIRKSGFEIKGMIADTFFQTTMVDIDKAGGKPWKILLIAFCVRKYYLKVYFFKIKYLKLFSLCFGKNLFSNY